MCKYTGPRVWNTFGSQRDGVRAPGTKVTVKSHVGSETQTLILY